jgi:hypothetical protein
METQNVHLERTEYVANLAPHASAVSWAAIFAGATAAAALSLVLLILGTGLGFAAISPWAQEGISGTTFGVSTIVWITLTSIFASGLGGYVAGRLRVRWASAQTDEVYFRDTAHGLLSWAVATLFTATLLTTTVSAIVSGAVKTGAALTGTAATAAAATAVAKNDARPESNKADDATGYYLDVLFRKTLTPPAPAVDGSVLPVTTVDSPAPGTAASRAEVARVYANAVATGNLPAEDASYVAQVVSQRTGISQGDAEKRVKDTFVTMQTKARDAEVAAREAADKARKATAYGSLWLVVSLLIGAFAASLTAVFGGRQRDY